MEKILDGVQELLDRVNNYALATCGGCGLPQIEKDRGRLEPGLQQVFSVKPLGLAGEDVEAQRATERGATLLHEGRVDEALRELHDAKRRAPHSHEARNNLGCAYYERGDEDASVHWYREAHRLAPHSDTATLALAFLEQRNGHASDAQWLLVNFLQEVDPNHAGALRQLAKLQQVHGHWQQAAGTYRKLMAAEPQNPEWRNHLQRCLERGGFADDASQVETVAPSKHMSRDYEKAFDKAAAEMGGGLERQIKEARSLQETGHPVAALAAFRGLLRSAPNPAASVQVMFGIVDCMVDLEQLEGAVDTLKQALRTQPDDAEVNLRMAELLLVAGQTPQSAEPYMRVAMSARADGSLRHRLMCVTAEAALAKEDYKQALSSASEAVRLDASSAQALIVLGTARLQVAEYGPALRALTAAIDASHGQNGPEAKRRRVKAHTLCAQVHERQRQFAQAIEQAQRALELNPQFESAHVVRAMALHQSGRAREAALELEAVLQRSPQHAGALLQLGYLQLCQGDARAVSTLDVAAFGVNASGSTLGSAKVYLALASDLHPERSSRGRPEQVLREGLAEHKNLQCVWQEIEHGLGARQPLAAVQKLRGICDLDLSSSQARQLLRLLAQAFGRSDLAHAASSLGRDGSVERAKGGPSGAGSRAGSVPPNRWAPTTGMYAGVTPPVGGGLDSLPQSRPGTASRQRSSSPGGARLHHVPRHNGSLTQTMASSDGPFGPSTNSFAFGSSGPTTSSFAFGGSGPTGSSFAFGGSRNMTPLRGRSMSPAHGFHVQY
eukprot:TRINITY_DN80995_c0_g1_i1.p1 TRINITY_DN80995_c0_g1~~TRINITY_DN80995_c0_g1_i1.p1  ORF type:complete len:782 (-),score=98.70 TRINITY_DN80995_c0_g1_i1:215-2560(-)